MYYAQGVRTRHQKTFHGMDTKLKTFLKMMKQRQFTCNFPDCIVKLVEELAEVVLGVQGGVHLGRGRIHAPAHSRTLSYQG